VAERGQEEAARLQPAADPLEELAVPLSRDVRDRVERDDRVEARRLALELGEVRLHEGRLGDGGLGETELLHREVDTRELEAAAREAREESGIGSLSFDPTPLALDVHPITCSLGVPTRHFDVQFLAVAPAGAEPVRSEESTDLRWFGWHDLPADISAELPALIAAARRRLETE
jgi:8-oxo-dGTP pyrophosphatase MutT (NUDIX family)